MNKMEDKILEIIADGIKINKEELLNNLDSKEIWDSLLRVEILFAIEEEFDIVFSEEELAEITTPAILYNAVLNKVEE